MKKIVITGPHCCGKSTVIKRIEEDINKDNDIRFVHFSGKDSPIDYSSAQKLKDNTSSEIDITYYMISKLLEREIDIEYAQGNVAVLDRCLIDQIVYPSVLLDEQYLCSIFGYIRLWLDTHPYMHVFYIPKNYELLEKYGKKIIQFILFCYFDIRCFIYKCMFFTKYTYNLARPARSFKK